MRLLLTAVLASVAVGVAAWLLTGQPALVAGGALGGLAAPAVLLRAKAGKRVALVEDQVAAACLRLSQALGAGMPLERAFADTAREMPAPLGEEMRATLTEAELHGVPLEAAMGDMVRRLPHAPSLRMLVASMQVAMEMGADLADQLARLADVIQQRRLAVARIASVTATARTQAKVLAFVPLAAFVWVHTLSPQTVAGYETFGGQVKLLLIAAWVVLGYVVSQGIVSGLVGRVM
jgi:tight adherence protein B